MVSGDGGDAPVAVPLAPEAAHGQAGLQERLRGDPAEQAEKLGPDDLDLALEVREAVRDLVGLRVAVARRARFQDVRDVDFLRASGPCPW